MPDSYSFLKSYTTSLLPIVQLENMFLFDREEDEEIDDTEKACIIAEQDENGGWNIINIRKGVDRTDMYQDFSFRQMMEELLRAEDIIFAGNECDKFDDLRIFLPDEQLYTPTDEEINILRDYIKKNNYPENHICCLALKIAEDKVISDRITEIVNRKTPEKQSVPGIIGEKFFLN